MQQNEMKTIATPDGQMEESSLSRRVVAGLTDLFLFVAIAGICGIVISSLIGVMFGFYYPATPLVISIIVAVAYIAVPRVYGIRTIGQWALGLRRFSFNVLSDYTGNGAVWCVERIPQKEYSRRTVAVLLIFASFYVTVWVYNVYVAA